jgi:hypothetical protein
MLGASTLCATLGVPLTCAACGRNNGAQTGAAKTAAAGTQGAPLSLPIGRGGDLGGLAGADAHCLALASAEGSGDHTWRAYLSTMATKTEPAANARDRIGKGPWYNAEGDRIAANLQELHSRENKINKENAVTERLDPVNGVGDNPNTHDMLTGSRPDGTAFEGNEDLTCGNWTSSGAGRAQIGHHDRMGQGEGENSWNSAHPSRGCSQQDLQSTGGAGLFYCFAVD